MRHSRRCAVRILIVAVNHQIQSAQIISASTNGSLEAFEQGQKENFAELIRGHIRTRGVQFIGEETRYGEESIAQRVCGQEGCRHANVDMTPEERNHRNIPPGYYEDTNVAEGEKARCNQEREEHLVATILAEAGPAERVLAICGRLHAEPIAVQLVELGHSVERIDVQDESWYVEDWFGHMRKL